MHRRWCPSSLAKLVYTLYLGMFMVDSGIMVMLVSPPLAPPSDCLLAAKITLW